jgi:hypothetical protein
MKSTLSSKLVYLLATLSTTKEVLEFVDKYRKKFLWVGDGNLKWVNGTRTNSQ